MWHQAGRRRALEHSQEPCFNHSDWCMCRQPRLRGSALVVHGTLCFTQGLVYLQVSRAACKAGVNPCRRAKCNQTSVLIRHILVRQSLCACVCVCVTRVHAHANTYVWVWLVPVPRGQLLLPVNARQNTSSMLSSCHAGIRVRKFLYCTYVYTHVHSEGVCAMH